MSSSTYRNNIDNIFQSMEYGEASDSTDLFQAWISERSLGPIINGKPFSPNKPDGTVTNIKNPSDGQVLATMIDADLNDVEAAVKSSSEALETWKKKSSWEKTDLLYRIGDQLQQHSQLISEMTCSSMGVQTRLVKEWDIPLAAGVFKYYGSLALDAQDNENVGIAAVVVGGPCPLVVMAWLVAPLLAAGGTVCLKPSHSCSLVALLLADICNKAGLPEGVVNVLPGLAKIGECLTMNALVNHICFFGDIGVAKCIRENVAGSCKTLKIMNDSKTTMIVYDSADIESAAEEAIRSAWIYQGQVPWAVKSLFVQESIFTEFIRKLETRMSAVRTTSALDKIADVGPALKIDICDQVTQMICCADSKGIKKIQAKLAANLTGKNFFPPTFLVGAGAEENSVLSDNGFAPVVTVLPFRTAKESIALATNSHSGLAVSVWTENLSLAFDVARRLEAGTVWLNCHGVFDAAIPFSTRKKSGHGCFGGKKGILPYLAFQQPKCMCKDVKDGDINISPAMLAEIKKCHKLYYGGDFKSHHNGIFSTVCHNNDGKPLALFADGTGNDIYQAVEASLSVKSSWEQKSSILRAQILYKLSKLVRDKYKDILREIGQLSQFAEDDLSWCAERLLYWASVCNKQQPSSSTFIGGTSVISCPEPMGVIAAFLPNDDNKLMVDVLASSICFGNRIVISCNSLFLLQLCGLLGAAGVSAGAVAVMTGKGVVVPLSQHQSVDAIWFKQGNEKNVHLLEKAASYGIKNLWAIPAKVTIDMWESNSTISKTIWVSAGSIFAN